MPRISRRPERRAVALASLAAATGLLLLSWHHLLPGGWWLRRQLWTASEREAAAREPHRRSRLAAFARENAKAPAGTIVFLGSSTIERWPLESTFPGKLCLNRGIGGDSALDIAERLGRSVPEALPSAFVLYSGSRDLRAQRLPVPAAAARVRSLMEAVSARWPSASLCVLGLLPALDENGQDRARAAELDQGLRELARELGAAFVPLRRAPIADTDGRLNARYAADPWHLRREGYQVLGQWLVEDGGAVGRLLAP